MSGDPSALAAGVTLLALFRRRRRRHDRKVRIESAPPILAYVEKTRRGWLDRLLGRS